MGTPQYNGIWRSFILNHGRKIRFSASRETSRHAASLQPTQPSLPSPAFLSAFISETRDQLMSIRTFNCSGVASNPTMPFAVRRAAGLIAARHQQPGSRTFRVMQEVKRYGSVASDHSQRKGITFLHCGAIATTRSTINASLFSPYGKARYRKHKCNGDPVRDAGSRHSRQPTDAGVKHQHGGTWFRRLAARQGVFPSCSLVAIDCLISLSNRLAILPRTVR